jgi:hypothetical protein
MTENMGEGAVWRAMTVRDIAAVAIAAECPPLARGGQGGVGGGGTRTPCQVDVGAAPLGARASRPRKRNRERDTLAPGHPWPGCFTMNEEAPKFLGAAIKPALFLSPKPQEDAAKIAAGSVKMAQAVNQCATAGVRAAHTGAPLSAHVSR